MAALTPAGTAVRGTGAYRRGVIRWQRRQVVAPLAAAFLVVFAVLAMHVLMAPTAMAVPDRLEHSTSAPATPIGGMAEATGVVHSGGHSGGHSGSGSHGGLVAMCLVVLGALVLMTIASCRGRCWTPLRLLAQRAVRPRLYGTRSPAPPDLHVLCIARC